MEWATTHVTTKCGGDAGSTAVSAAMCCADGLSVCHGINSLEEAPTTSDKCNRKAVMDELHATNDPELRMAMASDTCLNTESVVLAAFYSRFSKKHACRSLWGPSYLKPSKC